MVFIVSHWQSFEEVEAYKSNFDGVEVLICGSCAVSIPINRKIPYHPLFLIDAVTTVQQQHTYIDAMLRAIQIEVPSKVIFIGTTLLDTYTVLTRIKEHCGIVGVEIVEL